MPDGVTRALVLGGGGVAGIAWEIGALRGLEEAGVAVNGWSVVVGTSAGSVVGARVLADPHLEGWFAHETRAVSTAEDELIRLLAGRAGGAALRIGRRRGLGWLSPAWIAWLSIEAMVRHRARPRPLGPAAPLGAGVRMIAPPNAGLARLGAIAQAARTPSESGFLRVLADVLAPAADWPSSLVVTAVDTSDGATMVFDSRCGVPLLRAVGASSAVPIIFPTVGALGRHWMDGGMASMTHAAVAGDADEILVLAPLRSRALTAEVRMLRSLGRRVDLITPSAAASAVVGFGVGLLDPIRRPAAAEAGRQDGRAAASAMKSSRDEAMTQGISAA
jgi:NTE family protein